MIRETLPADQMSPAPPADCPWRVGDVVNFTNDYGVTFGPHAVVGFTLPGDELHGRVVYLDYDCYWFPAHSSDLSEWKPTDAPAESWYHRGLREFVL